MNMEVYLVYSRVNQEPRVPGEEWERQRVEGDEVIESGGQG